MQVKDVGKGQLLVRLEKGEEIISSLVALASERDIGGGFFYGLGAAERLVVAYYDVGIKKYIERTFADSMEVTNVTGNLAYVERSVVVHAHVTVADEMYKASGGHLVGGYVSGTMEIFLSVFDGTIVRVKDEETGLKLLSLEE